MGDVLEYPRTAYEIDIVGHQPLTDVTAGRGISTIRHSGAVAVKMQTSIFRFTIDFKLCKNPYRSFPMNQLDLIEICDPPDCQKIGSLTSRRRDPARLRRRDARIGGALGQIRPRLFCGQMPCNLHICRHS